MSELPFSSFLNNRIWVGRRALQSHFLTSLVIRPYMLEDVTPLWEEVQVDDRGFRPTEPSS